MIYRHLQANLNDFLAQFPAVALLGPRQVGKTTLARLFAQDRPDSVYLDLERPADLARLTDAELFLSRYAGRLVVLDEIQRLPGLFPLLRSLIDQDRRPGRFLLLGSAAPALLAQTAESLAGRIAFLEMGPFDAREIRPSQTQVADFWLRGGYPLSWLAHSDAASFNWREAFITTYLERDIPALGIRVPGMTLRRFWQMLAHNHGQLWNASRLASSFGVSPPTVQRYLDILEATYMLRRLPPLLANQGKRLVKSPKVYIQDSGLLHALLGIRTLDELYGHPVAGASWEGWVVEQLVRQLTGWTLSFYRTAAGAELDMVAERAGRRLAFEIKLSTAPAMSRGFWLAIKDVRPVQTWVIAPVEAGYPLGPNVDVFPAHGLAQGLQIDGR